jgi:hypothetical protein
MAGRRTTYIVLRAVPQATSPLSRAADIFACFDVKKLNLDSDTPYACCWTVVGDCWISDIMKKRETVLLEELHNFTIM